MAERVALVNHSFALLGGREIHAALLASGLRDIGLEVDVWACRADAAFAKSYGLTLKTVNIPFGGMLRPVAFAHRMTSLKLGERYDRVISMSPMAGQHVHIAGGARNLEFDRRLKARLLRAHHDWTVSDAPVVITSTKSARDVLARRLPHAGRVAWLYPPIATARLSRKSSNERAAAREAFGFDRGKNYLLFPSTGHARKGFDVALAAVRKFAPQGVRLVVAGKPVTAPGVISLGTVDDMATLYAAVDCTILPTRDDPFGLVIAESISRGTPVITSVFAGASEIMSPDDGIVVDEVATPAVERAIEQFLSREWPAERMSDLGYLSPENYAAAVYGMTHA